MRVYLNVHRLYGVFTFSRIPLFIITVRAYIQPSGRTRSCGSPDHFRIRCPVIVLLFLLLLRYYHVKIYIYISAYIIHWAIYFINEPGIVFSCTSHMNTCPTSPKLYSSLTKRITELVKIFWSNINSVFFFIIKTGFKTNHNRNSNYEILRNYIDWNNYPCGGG